MARRILVVDDEVDVESLFRQGLRKEIREGELEVEFAQSGTAALDRMRRVGAAPFDMVISDLNMPGMNGLELMQVIREKEPDMPLAVVTAYADPTTNAQVVSAGAEYFFPKPVNFTDIRACLASLKD